MNWGNKLLITFLVFGAGMTYLVYRSMHTNFDLVEKDYYKTELKYQQVIDASDRATSLSAPVKFQQTSSGILVQLPAEMMHSDVSGEIWFYCSYSSDKDRKFRIRLNDDASQLLPAEKIFPGTYTVKTSWTTLGKTYYSENVVTIL